MEPSPISYEAWLGQLHPFFVHFPIVLFTLTLLSDILGHYKFKNSFVLGCWLLWAGTLMTIPALVTGWEASKSFPDGNPLIQAHMIRAFCLTGYAFTYSIFRWIKSDLPPFVWMLLSVILLFLTSWTSGYGESFRGWNH